MRKITMICLMSVLMSLKAACGLAQDVIDGVDWSVEVKASNNGNLPCLAGESENSCWEYPNDNQFIKWQSAVVPEKNKGKKVTFIMAAGMGSNLGVGVHELFMNGKKLLEIKTTYGMTIKWKSDVASAQFETTHIDENNDIFGLFSVTVNPEIIEHGKSQKFEMKGESESSFGNGWFAISEVKNLKSLNVKDLQAKAKSGDRISNKEQYADQRKPNSTNNPAKHSLLTSNPGKVCLDLWGWQTCSDYQRVNPAVVSPEYMSKRAVDESYKWGANILEITGNDGPLLEIKRAGWTKESTAAFHKHVHSRDMTIHGFCCNALRGNTFDGAKLATIIFDDQFDCLEVPADELLDGMGSEQWSVMPPSLFMKCVLPYSPFVYFYTDNHCFQTTLPNEMDVSASNGTGADDQTGGYYKLNQEIKKQGGLQFWGTQAPECRSEVAANKFGGRGHPDWVLKQINDQFRCRAIARGSKNLSPSAFWAIHEAENMCSDSNRVYVYGCGQDPIKTAATAKFTALGEGWANTNVTRIHQRYPYPSKAAFIQNNYLNLVLMPDKDEIFLQSDPERLAHWDGNSHSFTVSSPFLRTISMDRLEKSDRNPPRPSAVAQGAMADKSATPPLEGNLRASEARGSDPLLGGVREAGGGSEDYSNNLPQVTFKHVEPAGYKSVLQAEYKMKLNDANVDETRTFTMLNDSPYVRISIDRSVDNASTAIGTEIPVKGYDQLIAGGKTYTAESTIPVAEIIRLMDSAGKLPELVLMMFDKGNLNEMNWKPNVSLILKSVSESKGQKESIDLALVIPDGLYKVEVYPELYKFIASPEETVTLDGEKETEIKNEFNIPVVKVVKVHGNREDPYQVYEFGKWVFRGAQVSEGRVSQAENGYDYLKVYLPANGTAKIKKYGFINDTAKTGWGCQYTTALKDVSRDGNKCSAVAEVMDITSYIFAPRVAFKNPIASVKLDDKDWRYFEGNHVFLPNRRGTYKIEVAEGNAADASLARTFADIAESDFSGGKLTFTARLPEWTESIPDDYYFYAMINHPGKAIASLENAELCRKVDGKASVIRFKPGKVAVVFGVPGSGNDLAMVDQATDIEKHLRKEQAERTMPYLKAFDTKPVRIEDIASGKDNLASYDVIVWNHYFQDKLPAVADKHVADILRAQVENGKGLLLICNAMEIAPEILDETSRTLLTVMPTSHHLDLNLKLAGIQVSADKTGHPIFSGLVPIKDENGKYKLITFEFFDLFKRAKWDKEPESIAKGIVLADLYVKQGKGKNIQKINHTFDPGAVIREWTLGKGRIIGHYCQLRYSYGSIDKSIPSENAMRLIENAVKYLSGGKKAIKVAVVE